MFLRSLELQNVRSIEYAQFTFDGHGADGRKWTLLLGENGVGKSTVLRSIALLLAGSDALPELLVRPENWLRLGQDKCRLAATLTTAEGDERHVELTLCRGDSLREVFSRNEPTLNVLDRALQNSLRNYFCVGYGVGRRLSRLPGSTYLRPELYRHPRARNVGTLFSSESPLQFLENWAIDLVFRRRQEGLEVVRETLSDLLPEVRFKELDRERGELLFETPDGIVPLEQLSEGYQNMAGWVGDFVHRLTDVYFNYKHPLTARALLLVDEIDLHLHPSWQRRLRTFLDRKLPHVQMVATTHSPLTAQQSGRGELHVLHRLGRQAVGVTPFEGEPRRMSVHELLLSPLFGVDDVERPAA